MKDVKCNQCCKFKSLLGGGLGKCKAARERVVNGRNSLCVRELVRRERAGI